MVKISMNQITRQTTTTKETTTSPTTKETTTSPTIKMTTTIPSHSMIRELASGIFTKTNNREMIDTKPTFDFKKIKIFILDISEN
jgi:hypothetical protein